MTSLNVLTGSSAYRLRAESHDVVRVLLAGVPVTTERELRRLCHSLHDIRVEIRSRYVDDLQLSDIDVARFDAVVFGDSRGGELNEQLLEQMLSLPGRPCAILLGDLHDAFGGKRNRMPAGAMQLQEADGTDALMLAILQTASAEDLDGSEHEVTDWNIPSASEGIVILDSANRILFANRHARRRTRSELGRMIDRLCEQGWPDNDLPERGESYRPANNDISSTYLEWEGARYTLIRLHSPMLRVADAQTDYRGSIEASSGLPDREMFTTMCQDALDAIPEHDESGAALLLISLDELRVLRGVSGESQFNAVLRAYATRIRGLLRTDDYLARLGQHEFGVLLHGVSNSDEIAAIAAKLRGVLESGITVGDEEVHSTAAIGISLYPVDGRCVDELLCCADMALHRSRDSVHDGYEFYNPQISKQLRDRLTLERRLRRALPENNFRLHFQPLVLPEREQIIGAEALLRLRESEAVVTMPGAFIPVLEETGLIDDVGRWIIDQACQQLREWHDGGLSEFMLSLNISPRQFADDALADFVIDSLDAYGVPPCSLLLEITESAMMRDPIRTIRIINRLRDAGICTAIDDFGTGYSSLSHLKHLPVTALKLDRSFVHGLPENDSDVAITLSLIDLARHLGLWVIAEGVEEAEQKQFLAQHGVELMQGFLFHRPMPPEQLLQTIRND